jgi:hypothetical protein
MAIGMANWIKRIILIMQIDIKIKLQKGFPWSSPSSHVASVLVSPRRAFLAEHGQPSRREMTAELAAPAPLAMGSARA